MELQLIKNTGVPKGEPITPYAMMIKVLCVIEGSGARVFVGRKQVRKFIHFENGIKKKNRLFLREEYKAKRIFKELTKVAPILIKAKT